MAMGGCGDTDPTIDIVRIYDPLGEATVALEAADTGSAPESVRISWSDLPQTDVQGFEYAVWLLGGPGDPILAARLAVPRDSSVVLTLAADALVEAASEILVTLEPADAAGSSQPSEDRRTHYVAAGPNSHAQLALLVASDGAGGDGFAIRFAIQAERIQANADVASTRADAGDIEGAHSQLEYILNIVDVPPLDHDGDGTIENPDGDDIGLTTISQRVSELATGAGTAADAWAAAAEHGMMAATAADTAAAVLQRLVDLTEDALSTTDEFMLQSLARSVVATSDTLIGDPAAIVSDVCSRCGVLTAWHQSLAMTALSAQPLESFTLPQSVVRSNRF